MIMISLYIQMGFVVLFIFFLFWCAALAGFLSFRDKESAELFRLFTYMLFVIPPLWPLAMVAACGTLVVFAFMGLASAWKKEYR